MMINRLCLALVATTLLISLATASRSGDDFDVESPFACTVSAFDSGSCKTTKDDNGEGCVWCTYQSNGFCISADQSDIIEQAMPDITCGGDEEEDEENEESEDEEEVEENEEPEDEEIGDPFDPTCVVAGINSDDAETICKSTVDQDGDSCEWCDVEGIYGLCLNPDQADAVSQYATCGSSALIDTKVA